MKKPTQTSPIRQIQQDYFIAEDFLVIMTANNAYLAFLNSRGWAPFVSTGPVSYGIIFVIAPLLVINGFRYLTNSDNPFISRHVAPLLMKASRILLGTAHIAIAVYVLGYYFIPYFFVLAPFCEGLWKGFKVDLRSPLGRPLKALDQIIRYLRTSKSLLRLPGGEELLNFCRQWAPGILTIGTIVRFFGVIVGVLLAYVEAVITSVLVDNLTILDNNDYEAIDWAVSALGEAAQTIWNNVVGVISEIAKAVAETIRSAVEGIHSIFNDSPAPPSAVASEIDAAANSLWHQILTDASEEQDPLPPMPAVEVLWQPVSVPRLEILWYPIPEAPWNTITCPAPEPAPQPFSKPGCLPVQRFILKAFLDSFQVWMGAQAGWC